MTESLDINLLNELQEIMEEEFPLLLETYLTESQTQYQLVVHSADAKSLDELRRSAHALKGSCANVGAMRSAEICQVIEQAAASGEIEPVAQHVALLEAELQIVRNGLSERLS